MMKVFNMKFFCLIFSVLFYVNGYNILGIFPIPIKSHMRIFASVMKELAKAGHNVKVVSPFPEQNHLPNYVDIDLSNAISRNFIGVVNISEIDVSNKLNAYMVPFLLSEMADIICESLASPQIKVLLNDINKYDAIILENFNTDCYFALTTNAKAPLIGISSSTNLPWVSQRYGNPTNPSYIPNVVLNYSHKMSFLERLENTIILLYLTTYYKIFRLTKDKLMVEKYLDQDMSDLQRLATSSSLELVNTHFSINFPAPLVPNVIEIGGIHIEKPKPLPKDLREWIENSKDGVIYFSMGAMTNGSSFAKERLYSFIDALDLLPHRVVWKWDSTFMDRKTEKILIQNWTPQLDLLCHPHVKLFISHGGLLGLQEAVYCGVPVVVMPLYGDQPGNAKAIEASGGGIILYLNQVTEETAYNAIIKALHLSDKMKIISARFKDRPLTPAQTAVYWTEYVIRHNGAPFMRTSAIDMNLYQYYLFDVIISIVGILFILKYLLVFIIKFVFRKFILTKVIKEKHE